MRDCATAFVSHLKSSLLSQYLSSWESNRVWHEDLKSRKIEIGTVKFDCVKRDSFFTQIVQELPGSSRTGLRLRASKKPWLSQVLVTERSIFSLRFAIWWCCAVLDCNSSWLWQRIAKLHWINSREYKGKELLEV